MFDGKKALNEEKDLRRRGALGQAITLGTNLAVGMGTFTLIGYYVDKRRGSGYFWTIAGMLLGFVYGGYELWRTIRDLNETAEREDKESGASGGGAADEKEP